MYLRLFLAAGAAALLLAGCPAAREETAAQATAPAAPEARTDASPGEDAPADGTYRIGPVTGTPNHDARALEIVATLLEHARCLAGDLLAVDGMADPLRQDREERDGEGRTFVPVSPLWRRHTSVADIQADMDNTFTAEAVANSNLHILSPPQYYRDFHGALYASNQAGGVWMAPDWHLEEAAHVACTADTIRVTMPVTVMDETFTATLEAVRREGRWLLNDSYLARAPAGEPAAANDREVQR